MILTATSSPAPPPPTSPTVWSGHNGYETGHRFSCPASASPYRLLDEPATRSPGPTTSSMPSVSANCRRAHCALMPMTCCTSPAGSRPAHGSFRNQESTLLDYVRHQLDQQPKPTPQTVNHRLRVIHCLYRFHLWTGDPRRPFPFPAHLYDPIPARLWPAPPRRRLGSPPQATPARHRAAFG